MVQSTGGDAGLSPKRQGLMAGGTGPVAEIPDTLTQRVARDGRGTTVASIAGAIADWGIENQDHAGGNGGSDDTVSVDLSNPDILPLPEDRAREQLPISRAFTLTSAAPNHPLNVDMDYNNAGESWTIQVSLGDRKTIIPSRPARLYQELSFRDRILLMFIDRFQDAERITPDNLGDSVLLVCYPGPESPEWGNWLARRCLDDNREDDSEELLF